MKFKLFFILAILVNLSSQGIFIELYHWQATDSKNKKSIIFAGDYHAECCRSSKGQEHQDDIIDMALQQHAHVIAEDMGSYEGDIETIRQKSVPQNIIYASPLSFLISRCKDAGISCSNVELRYAISAFDEAIRFDREYFAQILSEINFDDIVDIFYDEINKIVDYQDDNEVLQQEYDKMYSQLVDSLPRLEYLASKIKKMIQALKKNSDAKVDEKTLEEFFLLHSPLIDAKLLHELYLHRDKKNIIVCVGCAHYWRIEHILPSLGFDLKKSEIKEEEITYDEFDGKRLIAESSAVDFNEFLSDGQGILA
jgi:hypothetical protein